MLQMGYSQWKGSNYTYKIVRAQIANRYGENAANEYDPRRNCFTYEMWRKKGFQVRRGEQALKSITFVKKYEVNENGEKIVSATFKKTVNLFYKNQVEKL